MERVSRMSGWLRRRLRPADGRCRAAADIAAERRAELLLAAAAAAFPVAPAAHPSGFGCSCDRVGCPAPGMHPTSFAWQSQATTDAEQISRWLAAQPLANFITATGKNHDVLDVPGAAGRRALRRLEAEGREVGPVVSCGSDRLLFFTATRGTPDDEDEWWPCELDCHPETLDEHPGLRWHCRASYVLLPPSQLPDGPAAAWVRPPDVPLPDPLMLLPVLTEACAQVASGEQQYGSAALHAVAPAARSAPYRSAPYSSTPYGGGGIENEAPPPPRPVDKRRAGARLIGGWLTGGR